MTHDELTSELHLVISTLQKSLRTNVKATQSYSMTELETIGHLSIQSYLPSELASLTRVKTQSMSQILNKLDEQGIIKRTPSSEDKRKVYISLTAAGKKLVDKARNDKNKWLRGRITSALTDKERELLAKALPVLQKLNTIT